MSGLARRGAAVAAVAWLAAVVMAQAVPEGAVPMRLIAWPSPSPDGRQVVFEWLDDLWIASADGGEARRLTDDPQRDAYPRFSPDGSRIVFTSERTGSAQVFSIPVAGGGHVPHTHHSGGNVLEDLSPDGRRALVRGLRERSGHRATRVMEIDLEADRRERRLFDATGHSAMWSPDGMRVLFCRGGEQLYRKGYQGSRASQIWEFDARDGSLRRRDDGEGEARSPLWHADGGGYHWVSNRDGTFNLWSARDGEAATQVTFFKDDGVILPTVSRDGGTFIFRVGATPHRFRPGVDPAPVVLEFWTRGVSAEVAVRKERASGTNHADFTPALDRVVFSALGDLWLGGDPKSAPQALTETPDVESEPRFTPDGSQLVFLRDDGLATRVIAARLDGGALADAREIAGGMAIKSRLTPSPDGTRVAWLEGTGTLVTAAINGGAPTRVFECWDKPTYDWSPDGRWLVVAAKDAQSNRDLWLVAADGGGKAVNVTRHPAFEGSPKWSPDGRWIAFTARRDESGEAGLWLIDLGEGGLKSLPDEAVATRLGDRARALSTRGVEPVRAVWTADSKALWFQSTNDSNPLLYSVPVENGSMQTVAEYRGVPIRMTAAGELLWRVDRVPAILKSGELRRFPFSLSDERPREEVSRMGFRRIWRTLGQRFYDPTMNGRDWPAMLEKYEDLAAFARDSRQFDRVVGMLLGELNASHLTFRTDPWPAAEEPIKREPATAHTGLVFNDSVGDGPLRILRVVAGSPVALLPDAPVAGEVVVRLAGEEVDAATPLHPFLSGAEGRRLPLVLRGADGAERTLELRCISYPRVRLLDRLERERALREQAAAHPAGQIAYLPFKQMNWDDFLDLEREIFRATEDHEGMILDLRDNGGGRVADQLLAIFCQPVHARTIPRNGPEGYPHDRRVRVAWDKPLVVLCNENTYSNAEIFCHAIQQAGRAPLVGTETAGGVISAVSTRISGIGTLQVPFRGWFHVHTGANLDHRGAVPDLPVPMTPADESSCADPQFRAALERLEPMLKPR